MSKPKEVARNFHGEDSAMIGLANVIRTFFLEDIAFFVAFNAVFIAPYADNWLAAITAAESFIRDSAVIDQQVQLTNAVKLAMKNCRSGYQQAKFSIEKAFPDNLAVWNEFGFNDYEKVKNRQHRLEEFMQQLYSTANKYKVKLIAVGYTQAMITGLNTLRVDLRTANTAQENFIRNRSVLTRDRIILLNTVYDTMEDVCRVGKLIFANDYAKYQRYVLPHHAPSPGTTNFIIVVNQTTLSTVTVDYISVSATGGEQVNNDWGDGYESPVIMLSGTYVTVYHSYLAPGVYTIAITDMPGGQPGGVIAIGELRIIGGKVTSCTIPANAGIRNITFTDNEIVNFSIPAAVKLFIIKLANNKLNEASVNGILIHADSSGLTGGTIELSGGTNAAPTGLGIAAKNNLIGKGWTVTTN